MGCRRISPGRIGRAEDLSGTYRRSHIRTSVGCPAVSDPVQMGDRPLGPRMIEGRYAARSFGEATANVIRISWLSGAGSPLGHSDLGSDTDIRQRRRRCQGALGPLDRSTSKEMSRLASR